VDQERVIDRPLATCAGTLRLRTLTPDDAPEFARHVAGDRAHLREHLSWGDTTHELDGARAWLVRYHEGHDARVLAAGAFDGDTLVGGALLAGHEPAAAAVEVGCWATSAVVGRGVAGAASAALIGHARGVLAAERVVWRCTTVNPRSRALAERLGFRHEGTQRSAHVLRGERLDLDVLSLVGHELDPFVAG
jgi:RimJ/RimL family protein N-acetyltransferase